MDWSWKEEARFGSAGFVGREDLKAAGMLSPSPTAIFLGFFGNEPLWYDGPGGMILVAGARSGKLRDVLGYNICAGILAQENLLILDVKGELAAISANQVPDQKHCYYINPVNLHGLPQHRCNPLSHITKSSPTMIGDIQLFCESAIPSSGAAQAQFFEQNARRYLEAICIGLVLKTGTLTLPDIFEAINDLLAHNDAWLDLAWEMHRSGIPSCAGTEAEIAAGIEDSSGGFKGILGEITKAFACLSDPLLRAAVSPPYDFDLSVLLRRDRYCQLYLMIPPEMIQNWALVLKTIFSSASTLRSRDLSAPRQTWILDECAQLENFALVEKTFSFGAGRGIRPLAVFQDIAQMDRLSPNARRIISSSAAVQSYFGTRDITTAKHVSEMLGVETLDYVDLGHAQDLEMRRRAVLQGIMSGTSDAFTAAPELARILYAQTLVTKQRRLLLTPDEVLSQPQNTQFIFADNLPGPIYAYRGPYWRQLFMAGRFLANPYHPPLDSVRIMTRLGMRRRRIQTAPVPPELAGYPQYKGGVMSYVEGFA